MPNEKPKPSDRACPERGASRSRRGGRRPGAGAPRGNLNALKHGRRSAQFARIGALLAQEPKTREVLLALAARHDRDRKQANEGAALLFVHLIDTLERKSRSQLSALHTSDDWRSIKEETLLLNLQTLEKRLKKRDNPPDNHSPLSAGDGQSDAQIRIEH